MLYNKGMKKSPQQLPSDPQALQEMVLALQSQVKELEVKNQHLLEQFRLATAETVWF